MKKDTYLQMTKEFLEEFEAKIRKDERDKIRAKMVDKYGFVGLNYALGFLARIMDLNKNSIKKFMHQCKIIDMVDKKYVANGESKNINGVLCVKKTAIKRVVNTSIFVEQVETGNLHRTVADFTGENKDTYCIVDYEMHNAEQQKSNSKFDRIKKVLALK